jgi:hypothetical protein
MLKSFVRIAVLPAALIPFMAEIACSLPQAGGSYYPVVPTSDTAEPICYMQTIDGRTLDLSKICELNDSRNPQQRSIQSTGQLCNNQIACRDAFDPTQPPPQAIYIPTGSPN